VAGLNPICLALTADVFYRLHLHRLIGTVIEHSATVSADFAPLRATIEMICYWAVELATGVSTWIDVIFSFHMCMQANFTHNMFEVATRALLFPAPGHKSLPESCGLKWIN